MLVEVERDPSCGSSKTSNLCLPPAKEEELAAAAPPPPPLAPLAPPSLPPAPPSPLQTGLATVA
uniref:Uncharacterized protein n=1 Tax=Triticum urartu TaxID=4572 RepID=A0A8R7PWD4_TRIUA